MLKGALIVCALLLSLQSRVSGASESDTDAMQERVRIAVLRYICFQSFWEDWTNSRGNSLAFDRPLRITFQLAGTDFVVRIDSMFVVDGVPWNSGYRGRIANGVPRVEETFEWRRDSAPHFDFDVEHQADKIVSTASIIEVPGTCKLGDSINPERKARMIDDIVRSFEESAASQAYFRLSEATTITIADFDVDSPYTYLLLEFGSVVFFVDLVTRVGVEDGTLRYLVRELDDQASTSVELLRARIAEAPIRRSAALVAPNPDGGQPRRQGASVVEGSDDTRFVPR